ncbi:PA14 domain-containing protein [Spirosoma flavus]
MSFTHNGNYPKKSENPQEHVKAVPTPKFLGRPQTNDPIRFTLKADKQQVAVGEPLTITIVAYYLNISPNLLFTMAGSNAFRLKVLLPVGFVQTSGDYVDYVSADLSAAKPTVTYTLKGYFTKVGSKNEFRLLRSHALADASSLFVDKGRLVVNVTDADVARFSKGARSAGPLAFQIVSYDCNSGTLQYQFTGGDGSPINVVLPGIFAGTMYADNLATHTFPGDARTGRSVSGNANQSGNQISVNFTTSCNLTSGGSNPPPTSNPPSNPNPPSGGSLAFQIVSYDCNSGVLQYQMTGGDGSPINVVLPGIFAGTMYANNVATHTFPSDARQGRSVSGNASQSGNQISISFTTSCNLSSGTSNPPTTSNPPSNPNPPATGNCGFSEAQFLFSFYNEQIYAHYYNGILFAAYQDASQGFKPQHWLQAAGFDPSRIGCFAENDPRNGSTNLPSNPNPPSSGCGTGNGLTGFYTNSNDLAQNLVAVRNDAQLNFTWGGSPIPGVVSDDGFSVRWFGQVEAPVSGNYTFKTNNDDGTRLWVNGQLLIDDWNGHGPTWQQGSIYLNAGQKYSVVVDFVDFGGAAQAQLYWEYPGQGLQIIPSCRLYSLPTSNDFVANVGTVYDYQIDGLIIRTDATTKLYATNLRIWPWPKNPTRCPNLSPKIPKTPKPRAQDSDDQDDCGGGSSGGNPTGPTYLPPIYIPDPGGPNNPGNPSNPEGGGGNPGNPNPSTPTFPDQQIPTTADFEQIDCQKISGWAFANAGGYAYLDIYATNIYGQFNKVATIKANQESRPNIRAYFNNPNIPIDCGFVWEIPDHLKTGRPLSVMVMPIYNPNPIGTRTTSSDCSKPTTGNPGGDYPYPVDPRNPPIKKPESCKGTDRYGYPSNFTDGDDDYKGNGVAAHYIIQTYYKQVHANEQVELEYSIPQSGPNGGTGFADIVNLSTSEIFEIKSVVGKDQGVIEIERYIANAALYCNSARNWRKGTSFPRKIELPWITPNKKLVVYLDDRVPEGGVITYDLIGTIPVNAPVAVTENDWQKLKELLQQMALNLDDAKNLATNFVRANPNLIGALIGIGIVEVTTGIISEIASVGTATIPAAALAASGAILISVALQ